MTIENQPLGSKVPDEADNWTGPKLVLYGAVVLTLALAVILGMAYATPYTP